MNTKRNPYVFQIGFDFGTAYSKCVIRDLNSEEAFVYIPKISINDNMPFLFPSAVHFENGFFSTYQAKLNYFEHDERKLDYLKLALEGSANGSNKDILNKYEKLAQSVDFETNEFAFLATVFFLAKSISEIVNHIKDKTKDYGKDDYDMIAINMCIPVYCANEIIIKSKFSEALNCAWKLSDHLHQRNEISIQHLEKITKKIRNSCVESEEYCYLYPEVSANMHGFVRSRVSKPGTYMFSDIGAGTVDQCIFIFDKTDKTEKVAYISAEVFPLGSSLIERKSLKKFYLLPTNKQEIILSNLHKILTIIKSKISNIQGTNFDCIDIMLQQKKYSVLNESNTKYTLLNSLQLIKENRKLFDEKFKNNSSQNTTHFTKNKRIIINQKNNSTTPDIEYNAIDDLLYLIIESTGDIKKDLDLKTSLNFTKALQKIYTLNKIKLIFGGGGNAPIPYEESVKYAFHSVKNTKIPVILTLPKPADLDAEDHWMPRLSVAYGLSFNRFDLHKIILPQDIIPLELTHTKDYPRQMTSKDEC
ncbi:MAG: hypothetical protein LHW64_12220 [Candidatus Cloacimonetes bacterium]|nr:hypothetical protein [Candidatus Cloacimonadota bacterium]MDY0230846.1 hypothetical protein [Candidatus Cloacimonadaceae bacterium]